MAPAISLRSAVALLGRFPALAGADLEVETGEVLVLQGANGAGKTTLLRVCAGLVPLSSGEAHVLGRDLRRDRRAVRRAVALLGHAGAGGLYDDLTVEENVRFLVRAAGGDPLAVPAALDRLGVAGRLAALPASRLSTGQRRRTALAALVARRARLWLLDEPHAGLDEAGRDLVDGVIREVAAAGSTVVLASHEAERALAVADRAVTIAGGRVVAAALADTSGSVVPRQEVVGAP